MTKKHFIALADAIREHNQLHLNPFKWDQRQQLANFCAEQNPRFNRDRWQDYIDGKCGKNGGTIRKWKASDITDAQARLVCHLSPDAPVTDTDRKVVAADFNGTNTPKL